MCASAASMTSRGGPSPLPPNPGTTSGNRGPRPRSRGAGAAASSPTSPSPSARGTAFKQGQRAGERAVRRAGAGSPVFRAFQGEEEPKNPMRCFVCCTITAALVAGSCTATRARSRSRADVQLGAVILHTAPGFVIGGTGWIGERVDVASRGYFVPVFHECSKSDCDPADSSADPVMMSRWFRPEPDGLEDRGIRPCPEPEEISRGMVSVSDDDRCSPRTASRRTIWPEGGSMSRFLLRRPRRPAGPRQLPAGPAERTRARGLEARPLRPQPRPPGQHGAGTCRSAG